MEKKADQSLFVNDGSFMERFKQLQNEKQEKPVPVNEQPKPAVSSGSSVATVKPAVVSNKKLADVKTNHDGKKFSPSASNGKLAFSLKQKSKVVAPAVKLGEDDEEERGDPGLGGCSESARRQNLGALDVSQHVSEQGVFAPSPPRDPAAKNVADRLAIFVAKHGRQIEHVTRQKNPGDTPFKFLFDSSCSDYKYYEYRIAEEERDLAEVKGSQTSNTKNLPADATSTTASQLLSSSQRTSTPHHSYYQTSASALYEVGEETEPQNASAGSSTSGEAGGPPAADPIAMMEYFMKKAAQEERKRPPKRSKDEMPPPASLQGPPKKGHHMGDYIPQEELEKFLASCNDAAAQKAAREAAQRARIQADNVGHKLLAKMGWREGEGLGSNKSGRADPVMAGDVKRDNLGVGASRPDQVSPEDDIYEQYKKRMMLGYRYRPNPLNNPRKSYY